MKMNQLTRRDFIKILAVIPALALLKPEVPEVEPDIFFDIIEEKNYSPSLTYIKAYGNSFAGIIEGLETSGKDLLEATRPVVEAMIQSIRLT